MNPTTTHTLNTAHRCAEFPWLDLTREERDNLDRLVDPDLDRLATSIARRAIDEEFATPLDQLLPTPDAFASIMTTYHNSPTLFAFSLNSFDADIVGAAAAELFSQAARGDLQAVIDEQIPLAEAHRALERLESTPVFGKITLHP